MKQTLMLYTVFGDKWVEIPRCQQCNRRMKLYKMSAASIADSYGCAVTLCFQCKCNPKKTKTEEQACG